MADIPPVSLSPSPPAPAVSSNAPVAPVAPAVSGNAPVAPVAPAAAPSQPTLAELPVRQAPPDVPALAEGRVISSNPQTQELRIKVGVGEITVQSSAPLPEDTSVLVRIYIGQNKTLADLVVLKQTVVQPPQPEKIAAPPPALREGQAVTALLLPEQTPVKIEQPPKVPLPHLHPLSRGEGRGEGASEQRPAVMPATIRKLLSAYLPQIFGGNPAIPATPASLAPDVLDNNLVQIMRAQLHARATQQVIQSPAPTTSAPVPRQPTSPSPLPLPMPPPPPLQGGLGALLSLVENAQPQQAAPPAMSFQQAPAPPLPNLYQLTIVKILPSGTPPEQIKIALQKTAAPGLRQAEVESVTPGGFPILKTEDSHFVLKDPARVPVGSVVLFKAVPMTPEQMLSNLPPPENIPPAAGRGMPAFDPLLSPTWPALHEALQVLQQSDPAAAQTLRHALPTPSRRLVPTTLFFLAALRLGLVDNWLGGNALKILQEAGKKDLAARLGGDFGKISSQSKEALADDWRAISVPMLHDDQISQMQFYVRQQYDRGNDGKNGEQKTATRFVLNIQLSRMGAMQLDGFIQKKHFDVVLRSEEKLPFDMRQELMKRFAQGLEQVRMQGGISFQTRQQQGWVTVELPQRPGLSL